MTKDALLTEVRRYAGMKRLEGKRGHNDMEVDQVRATMTGKGPQVWNEWGATQPWKDWYVNQAQLEEEWDYEYHEGDEDEGCIDSLQNGKGNGICYNCRRSSTENTNFLYQVPVICFV